MEHPLFTNAKQFAAITGRSTYEIRDLCRKQLIPSEWVGKGYRIDTEAALDVLKKRAASFEGHKYDFTATKRLYDCRRTNRRAKQSEAEAFLADLDALKFQSTQRIAKA